MFSFTLIVRVTAPEREPDLLTALGGFVARESARWRCVNQANARADRLGVVICVVVDQHVCAVGAQRNMPEVWHAPPAAAAATYYTSTSNAASGRPAILACAFGASDMLEPPSFLYSENLYTS